MSAATKNGSRIKPAKIPPTREEVIFGVKPEEALRLMGKLTARERQYAALMASGMKFRDIAEALGISRKTCDIHRAKVIYKLNGRGPCDATRIILASKFGTEPAAHPAEFDKEEFEARR